MALHPFDIPLLKDQVTQYLSSHDLLCLVQVSRLWSDWFLPSLWHSFRIQYHFRELTTLTTPVKTITIQRTTTTTTTTATTATTTKGVRTVPYFYHHYSHTLESEEDEDRAQEEEEDQDQDRSAPPPSPQGEPATTTTSATTTVLYTPLALYQRYIHSLIVYKAVPVIFQEPCPYRFDNLQTLQLHNWVQNEEVRGIPPFLRAHPMVQDLTLGYMIRDPDQMRVLAEVLTSMSGLRKLSLTLTALEGRRCARQLVEALSRLQEARLIVHDFFEAKEPEQEESSSFTTSVTSLRRLLLSVPKALDTSVVFPFLRRCRALERLEIALGQSSQEEFGQLCNGVVFPRLEQLWLHTDTASDDVITSILADEHHREPEGGTGPWSGGGAEGGLRLQVLKISTIKKDHIYPGSFWALGQFHGQTLTSLELEGLERMAHLDYNHLLGRLFKLRNLKITISLWPPSCRPETSYGGDAQTTTTRRTTKRLIHHGEWACVHLRTLNLKMRHVPADARPPSPPGQFEHLTVQSMEASYQHIFGQIGKMKELQELVLQGPLNPLRLNTTDANARREKIMPGRLEMLSGLGELRVLNIEQLCGRLIGTEEVVWMLDHWPKLAQLKGVEKLSTKDVAAWLHARRPGMDTGRK
ncbi:hypothetical protein BGZ70_001020 [Mortierella alpina]|uniref:F-box domain-containing protein n=1 Tax=Mortierella alpina TaxID=64518 RepID=A0A9P6JC00_MORAP|nr:hypothetical protein BGZ70_001020 [Mortierella alpina]